MIIKQLSVFLENRPGRLHQVLSILAEHDVNIVALSLADSSDYGMLRMMVSDPEKAKDALKENDFSAMLTDVICIGVDHAVGSLQNAMGVLAAAGIDVEYMYAFANADKAAAVLKCSSLQDAIEVLTKSGAKIYQEKDVYLKEM
ncbi:MAG: ACT domain-containing protein [Lachnospiraceae bacterium]